MSLKKTWFSYVLWFVFAVAAILISYNVLGNVLQGFYAMLASYAPEFAFSIDLGGKVLTIAVVIFVVVLLQYLFGRVKTFAVPKWLGIIGHIMICAGIVATFCALRYFPFMHALYFKTYSTAPSSQAQFFFELSKVGALKENITAVGTMSILEHGYSSVLHMIFMFIGNKIEVLYWLQLILQCITFILLMFIGRTMQKGIFAWVPALLYAVMPTFFYSASDVGIANLWTFIVVLVLFVVCLLEKVWKKKQITYLVMVFVQLIIAGLVFWAKNGVLMFNKAPFISGGITPGNANVLNCEILVWTAFLIIYSVTFLLDKQDGIVLFTIPFAGFGFLFAWLSGCEYESSYILMMITLLNLVFMISESVRVIFKTNTEEVIKEKAGKKKRKKNQKNPEDKLPEVYEWEEMKEEMPVVQEPEIIAPIDRKAPIENVLPMPKKHKPRVFDYAFEPTQEMMHYDIELENDEYDY